MKFVGFTVVSGSRVESEVIVNPAQVATIEPAGGHGNHPTSKIFSSGRELHVIGSVVSGVLCVEVITDGITLQKTRTQKRLSATFVRTVTRLGRYGDGCGGHGLSLLVKPMKYGGQSRAWNQRLRINGKPVSIGLGSYTIVTLAEARKAPLENRRALSKGHDQRRSFPTLARSSERVLAVHSANLNDSGRTEEIWRADMRD